MRKTCARHWSKHSIIAAMSRSREKMGPRLRATFSIAAAESGSRKASNIRRRKGCSKAAALESSRITSTDSEYMHQNLYKTEVIVKKNIIVNKDSLSMKPKGRRSCTAGVPPALTNAASARGPITDGPKRQGFAPTRNPAANIAAHPNPESPPPTVPQANCPRDCATRPSGGSKGSVRRPGTCS